MNLTLDLQTVVGTHPRKARESCVREMASKGAQHGSHPFGSLATQAASSRVSASLHKQYIRLYYSCIAKRLGVNASYINRVANGEHQSEKLRRALLSELGLMQAAA